MTRRSGIILAAFSVVVAALAGALWFGSRRQQRALSAQIDRLVQARSAPDVTIRTHDSSVDGLPPPVARYLRLALRTRRHLREIRLRQIGTLRTDVNSERWMPFEAEHVVVPRATGFVWDARVQVAPLVHVRVRDALVEGKGSGQVSLFSAFTVSAAADTPEMNSGSLHRYLAEAVWYPTALLPSSQLKWSEIDATRALATLTSHAVTVSLEFRFAETGDVTGIYTPGRWATFPEGYRQVPWEGHFRDYRERDGVVVPSEGDVGWHVGDQWRVVWKGSISGFEIRTGR
jgi:hypothetical protein